LPNQNYCDVIRSPQLGRRYEARVEIVAEQEQEFLARLYQYLGMGLIINLMERLDQGHLHLKLEVPGLTCPSRESNPVGGKHSRKEPFEQLINLTILIRYNLR
jgi:hypothetical protein